VLTNLPPDVSAESVLQLYRLRWQIEMKFKTLKSLFHLDNVPARNDESLRVYVLAKLLGGAFDRLSSRRGRLFFPLGIPHHAWSATGA